MKSLQRVYLPAIAVLLLAFVLRVAWLDTRPLWYDDAFSVLLSERGVNAIAPGTAADTMPPGYYVLLYGWMNAFGQSPFAMRMLSVALSMLIVVFSFAIAARSFGVRTGLFAAFFVALMPFQIYHAQELRMYTLLALGGLIYLYGVLRLSAPNHFSNEQAAVRVIVKSPADFGLWRALCFIGLGTVLALYAHNLAFVTLLAANFYFLYKRAWRRELQLIAAQFAGAILFSPWLLYVPSQLEKIQRAFWTQPPGPADILQMFLVWLMYLPLPPAVMAFALFACVLILVLVLWRLLKMARREKISALSLLVFFALVPPLLLLVMSYLIRPVFVPRGAIVSAIALVILIALVAARARRTVRIGFVLGALGLAMLLLPFYYTVYGEWRRAPFAEADAFLKAQWRKGDLILHDNKLSFLSMHLYDRTLPQQFLADPPGSDNDTFAPASQAAMALYPTELSAAVQGKTRIWFVIYQTAIDEAAGTHPNLALLDEKFQRIQETKYGDLDIVLYAAR